MRRLRYSLVRRRALRFLRLAGYALLAGAALVALIQVQRSALQTLRSSVSSGNHFNPTPLLSLTGVEIRARSNGKPLLHFTADTLTLARDLREVEITNVRGGADTPAAAMPNGAPVGFAAAQASLLLGPSFQETANLHLDQASADTRVGSTALHVAAPGLVFQWPRGLVQTIGEVNAQVGNFGSVQCASLSLDVSKRMINFGPFQATVALAALGSAATFLPPSAQAAAPPADDKLHFAGSGSSFYSDNNSVLTIDGPVVITKGSVTMRTVGVIYNQKTQIATAQSPVTINDNQNTLTGTHGSLNVGNHVATLTGDVHMSAVPAANPGKSAVNAQANQPTNLVCNHLTYNYRTKLADADGNLKVLQKDRTVTADTGHYDVNAQLITMHGDVDGRSTDGKHLHAPEAVVSVNPADEWIQVKGPITYEFTVSDQDNPLPAAAHPHTSSSSATTPTTPAPSNSTPALGSTTPTASPAPSGAPTATSPTTPSAPTTSTTVTPVAQ